MLALMYSPYALMEGGILSGPATVPDEVSANSFAE